MNRNTEPPFAGFGRTVLNLFLWILISVVAIPWLTVLIIGMSLSYWDVSLLYIVGLFVSGVALEPLRKRNRIWLLVPSNHVAIITFDIPSFKARETSDHEGRTAERGWKLGEGLHFLSIFDQLFAIIPIELDYKVVPDPKFRLKIGEGKVRDLIVKKAFAIFRTKPDEAMILARISQNDAERKKIIEEAMSAYLERSIEAAWRAKLNQLRDKSTIMDYLEEISHDVERRLEEMLERTPWGLYVKAATLGNVDDPEKIALARDDSASMDELKFAASELMRELNAGLPLTDPNRLTPEDALDQVLVATGRKTTTRSEKRMEFDPTTTNVIRDIVFKALEVWAAK